MIRWVLLASLILMAVPRPGNSQDVMSLAPPLDVMAHDHPWDGGETIDVTFRLSPADVPIAGNASPLVTGYVIERAGDFGGWYREVARASATDRDRQRGGMTVPIHQCVRGEPYWFRVAALGPGETRSPFAYTAADAPGIATRQIFDGARGWLAVISLIVCGSVVLFILMARRGASCTFARLQGWRLSKRRSVALPRWGVPVCSFPAFWT